MAAMFAALGAALLVLGAAGTSYNPEHLIRGQRQVTNMDTASTDTVSQGSGFGSEGTSVAFALGILKKNCTTLAWPIMVSVA
jgi:hypothetical protein